MVNRIKLAEYSRKDWPLFPILLFLIIGLIWCCYDLFSGQEPFVWNIWRILGVVIMIAGRSIEFLVRKKLIKKARFSDQLSTIFLSINNDHQLITNGLFQYIRHPLYSGVIIKFLGFGLFSSSIYGSFFIIVGLIFLNPRIRIEEDMLIKEFEEEYRAYQKTTKKFIPFIY